MRSPRRIERIKTVLARRQPDLTVVMENIHDPHNVSAVLRTCDAVGIRRVELVYTTESFPRIGKKSSSSASKWIERRRHTSVADCCTTLRAEGFRLYATRLTNAPVSLYDLDLTQPSALILGNEHRGVSDEATELADASVVIPMMGMIESLNVSVAAAVCLYECLRQRLAAGRYDASALSHDELQVLFDDWIQR